MPFRCLQCKQLSATEEIASCTNSTLCDFEPISVVHYMHPDGEGVVLAKQKKSSTVNSLTKEVGTIVDTNTLKLCCNSVTASPIASPYFPAVTCMACISWEDSQPKPTKEE